jgi:UrcA family protein
MFRKASTLAATLLLTFVTGSPALAEQISRTVVHYHDLDLGNRSGVRALRLRVQRAASMVCSLTDVRGSILSRVDPDCRAAALDAAEPQIKRAVMDASRRVTDIELAAR